MTVQVSGRATLRAYYSVELDMTEEEFDALPESQQDDLLEEHIDWSDVIQSAEVDDIDVDDLVKVVE